MLNKQNISPSKKKFIIYIALTVITLVVYWHVHGYDFINYDDPVYVTENGIVKSGITLDGFRWAFSTKLFGLWNPLVWLSFMLDYQLYGLNAGGYHVTNLILHILSTLLLFWLFCRMTGAVWKSAFVAALFALHPLHVESVAWISERKDVLSAFFWMLTLCLYVFYTEKPAIKRYLLVLFSFILALLSKPMVVTLPVIMILLDYWPLGRFDSKKENLFLWQLKEKLPFFVLSAVMVIATLYTPNEQEIFTKGFPLSSRLANAPVAFITYLTKTFWPYDMAVFYPFPAQIPIWNIAGASLLIIIISAAVIVVAKRLPYLFVGWLWYVITIVPIIGIIQIGDFAMADRYHYLPSIGIAMMLAWGIPPLIKSKQVRNRILFPTGILILLIMAFLTWKQCGYWKNSVELFNHALQITKDTALVHNNLGLTFLNEGKIEEAINHFNKAIRIKINYFHAYYNRGLAYTEIGQYQKAIEDFNQTIHLKPDYAFAYNNRGIAYAELGQYQKAIEDFNSTIRLLPNFAKAYYGRANAYNDLSQHQLAIQDFDKSIHLKPNFIPSYINRGVAYFEQGKNYLGCNDAQKACELGNCKLFKFAKGKGMCP
jgi:tetratricopeptide (TPR) repeat protein/branched-subunit amino acid transport protein AzlD